MKLIREIPEQLISERQIDSLPQFGFTLVRTQYGTIQIWVEEAAS